MRPRPPGDACEAGTPISTTLDPEVEYAGQIELNGDWTPLSAVVAPVELAWLQRAALDAANARPTPEGKLSPL